MSYQVPARIPMPQLPADVGITAAKWRVLTDAVFPSAKSAAAIMLAVDYCKARGLDVFKRPVHIVPMYNKELGREVETVWPGINEIQVTAARTGQWAGMDPPKWGPETTEFFEGTTRSGKVSATVAFPEWCEVTIYRLVGGQRCAFTETVYWLESYARIGRTDVPNDMWQKRARGQLHKCAKAAVLRAAFPEESSDYTAEEMEGKSIAAGGVVIEGQSERVEEMPEPAHEAEAETMQPERAFNQPRFFKVYDDLGAVFSVVPTLREALEAYGKAKIASTDLTACTINNLPLLRQILTVARNGNAKKLREEIETAEAILAREEVDEPAGAPELMPDEQYHSVGQADDAVARAV